jgi:predicted double-glycine peptidase
VTRSGLPLALASLPANAIRVPPVKQARDFSCGAAATLALLRHWRRTFAQVDEGALYGPLRTSDARGTDPEPIAGYLRELGYAADYRFGDVTVTDLERAVDAREPPLVDLQAWSERDAPWTSIWDAGHYVVLVGYDAEHLFFMDPSTLTPGPYAYLLRDELDERWHDVSGEDDERLHRMAIFVGRGAAGPGPAASPDAAGGVAGSLATHATRLG